MTKEDYAINERTLKDELTSLFETKPENKTSLEI